jgi:hypothetical protein
MSCWVGLEVMPGAAADRRRPRLDRAVRRGGRGSAAGRGQRRRAVRPAVEAGAEQGSGSAAERGSISTAALPFFLFSGGRRFFSSPLLLPSVPTAKIGYSIGRNFDRGHGHP